MRIALVYDAIYPYSVGGGERRFFEMARELARAGHDVHLYGQRYWDTPGNVEVDGFVIHGLMKARPMYTATGRRSIPQAILFGLSCLRLFRERFDVIDCCGFPFFSLFACKLVCLSKRRRLYSTWHEVWGLEYWQSYLGRVGRIGWIVESVAARMPDHVIAVSRHTAQEIERLYKRKDTPSVVANGLLLDEIDAVVPSSSICDVLFVGRLVEFKNVQNLIHAIALLRAWRGKTTLTVLGAGPELEALKRLTSDLELDELVTFAPKADHQEEVIARMKASSVLALPSSREGFGMVALESLAAGTPVLTSDDAANAAKDLITRKTGLVTGVSPDAIGRGLMALLSDPPAAGACREAVLEYSWARLARRLSDVYEGKP